MAFDEEARGSFRALLFSGWGLLLAIAFALIPLVVAVARWNAGLDADPAREADALVLGVAHLPTLVLAVALVGMAGSGAIAPARRPFAAYTGRLGALLTIVLFAWAIPLALVLVVFLGGGGYAVARGLLAGVLEAAALLALVSLFVELGPARGAVAAAALVVAALHVVPLLGLGLISLVIAGASGDTLTLWQLRLGFLTPTGAADGLMRALFGPDRFFGEPAFLSEDHPALFSPWTWVAALLAWTLVPLAMLARITRDPPEAEEHAESA